MTSEELQLIQIKSFLVVLVADAMMETPSYPPGGWTPDQQENTSSEHRTIVVKGKDLI